MIKISDYVKPLPGVKIIQQSMLDNNGTVVITLCCEKQKQSISPQTLANKVNSQLPLFSVTPARALKVKKRSLNTDNRKEVLETSVGVKYSNQQTMLSRLCYLKNMLTACDENSKFIGYAVYENGFNISIRRLRDGKVCRTNKIIEHVKTISTIRKLLSKIDNPYRFEIKLVFSNRS